MLTNQSRHRAICLASAVATCAGALVLGAPATSANAATAPRSATPASHLGAAPASHLDTAKSAETGWVRLAHLSPDTPKVDVYLDSLSNKQKEQRFNGVGYGTVSKYMALPIGAYAVAMRASGADPTSPPVLTTKVTVLAGHAYTVAGVGRYAGLGLKVIDDDLTAPTDGHASVRVIQASVKAPVLNLTIDGDTPIASDVQFATTTSYHEVPAGELTLQVKPTNGGKTVLMHVTLQPDAVYTLLVLDGKDKLVPRLLTDLGRDGQVPNGGVETGAGGSQPQPSYVKPALMVAGVAIVLAAFLGLYARRRSLAWARRQSASAVR